MSFIAEYEIESPIMRATRDAVPGMVARMEDIHLPGLQPGRFVFWADADAYDALDAALDADPTVEASTVVTELDGHRLYRVTLTAEASKSMTYPTAADYDITFLSLTSTRDGYQIRARVPSRDALRAYREACRAKGLPFRLERLYQETVDGESDRRFGVTERQYEALALAYERGYYAEPREVTLADVAAELGISRQAASARLRRGYERLLANTLCHDPV